MKHNYLIYPAGRRLLLPLLGLLLSVSLSAETRMATPFHLSILSAVAEEAETGSFTVPFRDDTYSSAAFSCTPKCPMEFFTVVCMSHAEIDNLQTNQKPYYEPGCEAEALPFEVSDSLNYSPDDPSLAVIIIRTWTFIGDTTKCIQTINVTKGEGMPEVTAPDDITIACGESTDPSNTGMATVSGANSSVNYTDVEENPGDDCSTIIRTWTASNDCGEDQDVQIITRTPPPPLENECYSLAPCMDYDEETGTTRFTWELCLIGDDCKAISNIRFSIPCSVAKSDLLESSASMSGLKVEINGNQAKCGDPDGRYDVQFEGFGDDAMKDEPNQCVTFSYLIDADLREYVTDVSIKAGNQEGLDFPGISINDCEATQTEAEASTTASSEDFRGKKAKSLTGATDIEQIAVFPNPARDLISVRFESAQEQRVNLQVYDATGRVAFTRALDAAPGSNTVELSLGNVPAGLYQMVLTPAEGERTVKSFLRLQ